MEGIKTKQKTCENYIENHKRITNINENMNTLNVKGIDRKKNYIFQCL